MSSVATIRVAAIQRVISQTGRLIPRYASKGTNKKTRTPTALSVSPSISETECFSRSDNSWPRVPRCPSVTHDKKRDLGHPSSWRSATWSAAAWPAARALKAQAQWLERSMEAESRAGPEQKAGRVRWPAAEFPGWRDWSRERQARPRLQVSAARRVRELNREQHQEQLRERLRAFRAALRAAWAVRASCRDAAAWRACRRHRPARHRR